MSTHIPVMQVAFELVQQAENAGIEISAVNTYGREDYMRISLCAVQEDDTSLLADLLRLTNRRTQTTERGYGIEAFDGLIGIAIVTTQRRIALDLVEVA